MTKNDNKGGCCPSCICEKDCPYGKQNFPHCAMSDCECHSPSPEKPTEWEEEYEKGKWYSNEEGLNGTLITGADMPELKTFIAKEKEKSRAEGYEEGVAEWYKDAEYQRGLEDGRKEWENVNKQYQSREDAYRRGVEEERARILALLPGNWVPRSNPDDRADCWNAALQAVRDILRGNK